MRIVTKKGEQEMKKRVLSILIVAAMLFTLTACGSKLNVGTSPDFPPFEYVDEITGEMTGFDLELIKAIAEDQGYTIKYTSLGFEALVAAVKTGNIDVVASGCTITEEKAKEINYTDKYINAGLALAVRENDSTINSEADLQGKTCAVQISTTGYEKAQELLDAGILSDVKILNTVDLVMQELINGSVDCVINDLPVTEAYMAKQPEKIKIADDSLTSEDYGFIVAKENTELLEKLNQGLKNVMENGTYDELKVKYFGGVE